jgi:hypothetical protein
MSGSVLPVIKAFVEGSQNPKSKEFDQGDLKYIAADTD